MIAARADRFRATVLTGLVLEVRVAARSLARRRTFTAATVLLLGLGIGANAAVSGVGWAVLAGSMPYPDADRLVRLFHDDDLTFGVSLSELARYRADAETLGGVAGWSIGDATLTGPSGATRVVVARTTANLFEVLGRRPIVGRGLAPSGERELLLSHRVWTGQFGRDPAVMGRTLEIDEEPYVVVGVLPSDVIYPDAGVDLYLTVPEAPIDAAERGPVFLDVVARLAPGTTIGGASAEVDVLARAMRRANPSAYEAEHDFGGHVVGLRRADFGNERPLIWALWTGAGLALLAACLNVGFLLHGRAHRRAGELLLRRALGAGVAALLRLQVVEAALLATGGAVIGAGVAVVAGAGMSLLVSDAIALGGHRPASYALWAVPGVTAVALLMMTAVTAGIRPGRGSFHGVRTTSPPGTVRHVLPAAQVALAMMLVSASLLLLGSVRTLLGTDLGFRVDAVASAMVRLPANEYATPEAQRRFFAEVLARLRARPEILEAGVINSLPLSGLGGSGDVYIEDIAPDSALDVVSQRIADAAYFRTLDVPLLAGRGFRDSDGADDQRIVLVDETFARRYFGEPRLAVGRRIRFFFGGADWNEIVGVVGGVRHTGPASAETPHVYVPLAQRPTRAAHLVVLYERTAAAPLAAVRETISAVDAGVPGFDVATMENRLALVLRTERSVLAVFSAFGALALLLAGVGTYAVVSLAQELRTREIGVRRALGAPASAVAWRICSDGAVGVGLGLAGGVLGTAGLLTWLMRLLPATYAEPLAPTSLAAALVVVAATLATVLPAMRAVRVDPAAVLDAE